MMLHPQNLREMTLSLSWDLKGINMLVILIMNKIIFQNLKSWWGVCGIVRIVEGKKELLEVARFVDLLKLLLEVFFGQFGDKEW